MIVDGVMTGEWRMSAVPFFDAKSGRFQGFRGEARRPYLHEVAARTTPAPMEITGLSADSLRQLVHELRTPLNAILGFAEIIEQELFGAVGMQYREMAGNIAVDARHLLVAFEDLDLAARVSRGDGNGAPRMSCAYFHSYGAEETTATVGRPRSPRTVSYQSESPTAP